MDQDLSPCEGSQGGKRDYTGEHPPWVVSSSSHRWVPLVLGSSERETSPLAGWRTAGPNRMAVGSLIPPRRSTQTGLPQRQVERGCSKGCWISSNHLAVNPSLSVANTSTPLTPRHIAALDLPHDWGKDWTTAHRLTQSWDSSGGIPVGAYSGSVSEITQIPDSSCTTTAHLLRHARSPHGPALAAKQFHNRAGGAEARASDQL